jgi:hypothetical protein
MQPLRLSEFLLHERGGDGYEQRRSYNAQDSQACGWLRRKSPVASPKHLRDEICWSNVIVKVCSNIHNSEEAELPQSTRRRIGIQAISETDLKSVVYPFDQPRYTAFKLS